MERPGCPEEAGRRGSALVPAIVTLITGVLLLLIPLRTVNLGFFPFDDALRHAAKVVSEKPWGEILVLRDGITVDYHTGWHTILDLFRLALGLDARQLVLLSVVLLFLLVALTPLFFLERKEAWPAALLILVTGHIANFQRLLAGRPFLVSLAALLIILFAHPSLRALKPPPKTLALVSLAIALAVWTSGSWFLFALPLLAFLVAREWRAAVNLAGCTFAGLSLGALLTGEPFLFLKSNFLHAWHDFGGLPVRRMLVPELQSFDGYPLVLVAVVALMFWRWARGEWHDKFLDNPPFVLAVSGYLLGFISSRFWYDWGAPALCVWIALEIQGLLRGRTAPSSWSRVGVAALLSTSLFLVTTNDYGNRYSDNPAGERLSLGRPDQAHWLPAAGGIVYANSMTVFYRTFFENPRAPWRYVLGFEPTMMPEADLEVYRQYFLTDGSPLVFRPWIRKMRAEDRLILLHASDAAPQLPELQWFHAASDLWIGRLPGGRG